MNAPFPRNAEDILNAAKEFRIPDQVKVMAEEGVANSRKAYAQITAAAQDQAKATEDVLATVQTGARTIGEKMIQNTQSNTEAAFNAVTEIVRAKSVPDAVRLQTDFMKAQMTLVGNQTQELFQLSARIAQATFEQMSAVGARSVEQSQSTFEQAQTKPRKAG